MRRDRDDRDRGRPGVSLQTSCGLEAVYAREPDVHHYQIRLALGHLLQRQLATVDLVGLVAGGPQRIANHLLAYSIVFDYEYSTAHR